MPGGDSIIYEKRIINRDQLCDMLDAFDLRDVENADYTVGIFDEQRLVGFGSLSGDIISGVVVNIEDQNKGISAKIISHLINVAIEHGTSTVHLFTKPEKAHFFTSLGFRLLATAPSCAAMLEWGDTALAFYLKQLQGQAFDGHPEAAAIILHANPFTNGHKYLIERAADENKYLYVIVVEENQSLFSFDVRFTLAKKCTAHLPNVLVLPGGRYSVSPLTFPSYFTQENRLAETHASIDLALFSSHIAPALNIKARYIGTEPYNEVTHIYNEIMKQFLPTQGIHVTEVPRINVGGETVSASAVRHLLVEPELSEPCTIRLRSLVPPPTYAFIVDHWNQLVYQSAELQKRRSAR